MSVGDTKSRIEDWVADWFVQHGAALPLNNGAPLPDIDYLETGLIDSVATIEFIGDIEDEFGIRLTSRTMADPRFSKLAGLVELIDAAVSRRN